MKYAVKIPKTERGQSEEKKKMIEDKFKREQQIILSLQSSAPFVARYYFRESADQNNIVQANQLLNILQRDNRTDNSTTVNPEKPKFVLNTSINSFMDFYNGRLDRHITNHRKFSTLVTNLHILVQIALGIKFL